jgi:putative phosphoribosyl transferase
MFVDRADAGRQLGMRLKYLAGEHVLVVGLPRGGVTVAYEVARILDAPLDVVVVRKLGVPFQPELAMGAIGENGARVVEEQVVQAARVSDEELTKVEERERAVLDERVRRYRRGRPGLTVRGRTVVVVDDGIATGSTARAACQVVRALGASKVVLAVPVAPPGTSLRVHDVVDEYVVVREPEQFYAIGLWYEDFSQVSDDQVVRLLDQSRTFAGAQDEEILVELDDVTLPGRIALSAGDQRVVVFAHGSGSSHRSPRNMQVAGALREAGLGTMLFDLLTAEEEADRANVFDIPLLAGRLSAATRWMVRHWPSVTAIGYFGASTGAAAALRAASAPDSGIAAIVSRGGRPDLAGAHLARVTAPTLLVVGERDETVMELNRQALAQLRCEAELAVIPGATHLFGEPGALEQVTELARWWYLRHLGPDGPAR